MSPVHTPAGGEGTSETGSAGPPLRGGDALLSVGAGLKPALLVRTSIRHPGSQKRSGIQPGDVGAQWIDPLAQPYYSVHRGDGPDWVRPLAIESLTPDFSPGNPSPKGTERNKIVQKMRPPKNGPERPYLALLETAARPWASGR